MSIENVREYFRKFNMEDKIIELKESSATVELAARALNCEPARIAKTLSFHLEDCPILILTAGDVKIDNKKYKEKFGTKARMISFNEAETLIGHSVGGVCPFGIKEGVKVYLDNSLKRFQTVFPAAGSSNSAIEMNLDELEKYSNSIEWIDVTREREQI